MRANRAFELLVSRDTREPSFLGDPRRHDRIEIVSIDDGEVVLFWELPTREAARLARHLRADLSQLDAEAFMQAWSERGE